MDRSGLFRISSNDPWSLLTPPPLLSELLEAGIWPRNSTEANRQKLQPLVPVERIKALAPEESKLYLLCPPFSTIEEQSRYTDFWASEAAAPHEIDFKRSVDIADFGLGSDAPLILDYRDSASNPRVLRLLWSWAGTRTNNHWVVAAPDFETFVRILGLK